MTMKIIDFYFYLCSKYIRIGISDDEPSLLTGSLGVGLWLAINLSILFSYIPCQLIQLALNGSSRKLNFLIILIVFLILSFIYYKKNNRWKRITEHYEQKNYKHKLLIFIAMSMVAMAGMPITLKMPMNLITK